MNRRWGGSDAVAAVIGGDGSTDAEAGAVLDFGMENGRKSHDALSLERRDSFNLLLDSWYRARGLPRWRTLQTVVSSLVR